MKRNAYAELGSAHRVLKTAGATRHRERMRRVPAWANDPEKIKMYIQSRYPKMSTDPEQRKMAARTVRLIYLYYTEGSTAAQVAEALNMTISAVKHKIQKINRSLSEPMKPPHRPRKVGSIDNISEEAGDDSHITL